MSVLTKQITVAGQLVTMESVDDGKTWLMQRDAQATDEPESTPAPEPTEEHVAAVFSEVAAQAVSEKVKPAVVRPDPPHHRAKLTEAAVLDIRKRHANGETQHKLAAAFNVSQPTIAAIVSGATWRHVSAVHWNAMRFRKWRRWLAESNMVGRGEEWKSGILLLAALEVGQSEADLQRVTQFNAQWIHERVRRLRENGVWEGGKWIIDEDADTKDTLYMSVVFAMWMLIAEGEVVRVGAKTA